MGGSTALLYNTIKGTQHTSPVGAINLTSISMYIDTTDDSTAYYKGAVYLASTGALIGGSAEGNTVAGPSWRYDLAFSEEAISESTEYIMVAWGTATAAYFIICTVYYDDFDSYSKISKSYTSSYGTWPSTINPWHATENDRQYSIYVTYFGSLNVQVTDGKQMKSGVKIY